jgi:hypothetical protein
MKFSALIIVFIFLSASCKNDIVKHDDIIYLNDNMIALIRTERDKAFYDVNNVKIIVLQNGIEAGGYEPLKKILIRLIKYGGMKADSLNYDLCISIDGNTTARNGWYTNKHNGTSYLINSGYSLEGSITFEANNGKKIKELFTYECAPVDEISYPGYEKKPPSVVHDDSNKALYNVLPSIIKSFNKHLGVLPIISALNDKDNDVRYAAAEALVGVNDIRALEPLISVLKDDNYKIRKAAAKSLGNLKNTRAIESLIGLLKDGESVRDAAYEALNNIDINWGHTESAKKCVPMLIASLKDQDYGVRQKTAEALGSINDIRAVEPLIEILNDQNIGCRAIATEALTKITGETFGTQKLWQYWWDRNKNQLTQSQ